MSNILLRYSSENAIILVMIKQNKNTKIVCTLGPACEEAATIEKMVKAGMNVVRLNFSHGSYDQFKKLIKNTRSVSEKLNVPLAIMQDLQGPKIRVGDIGENGIKIVKNQNIILSSEKTGAKNIIPIQYPKLHNDVQKGHFILIEDGLMKLEVTKIAGTAIHCKVLAGGIVKKHKGVNLPHSKLTLPCLTAKDKADLEFGLNHNVDYVALSFVRELKDIQDLRSLIVKKGKNTKIIAKIERPEAIKNLRDIIKASDAIMVARGDLGIETEQEIVPLLQKRIIRLSNKYGKPVIVATQMLQSMIENPIATRAEVSDAANAVFDGTDALMLSNETAVGKYPVEAVQTLSKVASKVENFIKQHEELRGDNIQGYDLHASDATCLNGAKMALDVQAKMIVAISMSGYTAQNIAKHRLYIPIVTFTEDNKVRNQLALVWGLNQIYLDNIHLDKYTAEVKEFLKAHKLVKKNDEVVIVCNASKKEKLISSIKF